MNILIVDDEAPARNRIRDLLTDCALDIPIEIVGEADNGISAMQILESKECDVVLLDIRMPKMDGIELARHLLKLTHPPAVIFTTAYNDYAVNAFEVRAVDYLLKPIRLGRLFAALSRAHDSKPLPLDMLEELSSHARTHLSVQERGKVILVPVSSILYMRADLKYVCLRTAEKEYLIEESLSSLEAEFKETFIRIHRGILVAKRAIQGFERDSSDEGGWMVSLSGVPEKLPISRRQQHIVREFKG